MAAATQAARISSRLFAKPYDHDPGGTTAILVGPDGGTTIRYVDLKDVDDAIGILVRPTIVGGNGVTLVEIVADVDTTFATHLTVIRTSGATTTTTLDGYVWVECNVQEIRQLSEAAGYGPTGGLRYVSVRITMATGTDEADVVFIYNPRVSAKDLIATSST